MGHAVLVTRQLFEAWKSSYLCSYKAGVTSWLGVNLLCSFFPFYDDNILVGHREKSWGYSLKPIGCVNVLCRNKKQMIIVIVIVINVIIIIIINIIVIIVIINFINMMIASLSIWRWILLSYYYCYDHRYYHYYFYSSTKCSYLFHFISKFSPLNLSFQLAVKNPCPHIKIDMCCPLTSPPVDQDDSILRAVVARGLELSDVTVINDLEVNRFVLSEETKTSAHLTWWLRKGNRCTVERGVFVEAPILPVTNLMRSWWNNAVKKCANE